MLYVVTSGTLFSSCRHYVYDEFGFIFFSCVFFCHFVACNSMLWRYHYRFVCLHLSEFDLRVRWWSVNAHWQGHTKRSINGTWECNLSVPFIDQYHLNHRSYGLIIGRQVKWLYQRSTKPMYTYSLTNISRWINWPLNYVADMCVTQYSDHDLNVESILHTTEGDN